MLKLCRLNRQTVSAARRCSWMRLLWKKLHVTEKCSAHHQLCKDSCECVSVRVRVRLCVCERICVAFLYVCVHLCRWPLHLPLALCLFFWRRRPGEWLPRQPDHQLLGSTSCSFSEREGAGILGNTGVKRRWKRGRKRWSERKEADLDFVSAWHGSVVCYFQKRPLFFFPPKPR